MLSFNITINGTDVTNYACFPISGELALDRALDQGYIELRGSPRKKPYRPFSDVVISLIKDGAVNSATFLVASDDVETIVKTGLSSHKILLTEETKKLERFICPGKTFVQPLVKEYTNTDSEPLALSSVNGIDTAPELNTKYGIYTNVLEGLRYDGKNTSNIFTDQPPDIKGLIDISGSLPSLNDVFSSKFENRRLYGYAILIVDSYGKVVQENRGTKDVLAANQNPQISVPSAEGAYTVYYLADFGNTVNIPSPDGLFGVAYTFALINLNAVQKPPLYITDVVNQMLEISEPIRLFQEPRFKFNDSDASLYSKTKCAELNFPNGATLRECLDEIAGLVHSITRLRNGQIYFDKLGDTDEVNYLGLGTPVSIRQSENVEKYATHLDCNIDNLMNMQDTDIGSIHDPFYKVYRTVRAEVTNTDMRVTNSNAIITTQGNAIERPVKLTAYWNGIGYDITPYLYEAKEYQLLSTNTGAYPYTKSFAIYYRQGQPNVYGLTFRPEAPISAATPFKRTAIENIMNAVTESDDFNWTLNPSSTSILSLAFNFQFITGVNGRVRQCKKNIDDISALSAIPFNQFAPKVSSVNLGQRLRGEIAMMSEPSLILCFKTSDIDAVTSSVGKIYAYEDEKYYVSAVKYTVWKTYCIAELTLSKNFNQLGRYISINNAFRQFEISDSSFENRFIYEDYLFFSTTDPTPPEGVAAPWYGSLDISGKFLKSVKTSFSEEKGFFEDSSKDVISMAYITTNDVEGNTISELYLPVKSLSLGNSFLFNFSFIDNYSAGEMVTDEGGYKLTRFAKYGDSIFGEAKSLTFSLCSNIDISGSKLEFANRMPLPMTQGGLSYNTIFDTSTRGLIINKSSSDAPNITYQVHCVTDDNSLIFGNALTKMNGCVGKLNVTKPVILLLHKEVNDLDAVQVKYSLFGNYTITYNDGQDESISKSEAVELVVDEIIDNETPRALKLNLANIGYNDTDHRAWCIVSRDNVMLAGNGAPKDVYIYMRHALPINEED